MRATPPALHAVAFLAALVASFAATGAGAPSARAGVRFGPTKFDSRSPLFLTRDLSPFCDRAAAYWPALSRAPLYVSGEYWFTGGEVRSFAPVIRDLADREIPIEAVDGAALLAQSGYMGAAAYKFTYSVRLEQICDANPGRVFSYGELLDYLGSLRIGTRAVSPGGP